MAIYSQGPTVVEAMDADVEDVDRSCIHRAWLSIPGAVDGKLHTMDSGTVHKCGAHTDISTARSPYVQSIRRWIMHCQLNEEVYFCGNGHQSVKVLLAHDTSVIRPLNEGNEN